MAATDGKNPNVRSALLTACGLLGISGTAAHATEIKGAVLGYTEPKRVSALETVVDVNHEFTTGRSAGFKLVFDALTGASANGAVPWNTPQAFTRPSGISTYTTPAGETPLDDTFKDTRFAASGHVTQPLDRVTNFTLGIYGSGEHDYTSLGANGALSRDFNKRNTTLALRGAIFGDTVSPEGGRPEPLSIMVRPGSVQPRLSGDGKKDVMDLGVGLTQVINKSTIFHVNYTYSHVSGYQTDPYKVISMVNPVSGNPMQILYESRPDARTKHVVFGRLNHSFGRDIVRLSYRYMSDDWGVKSHMAEGVYRLKMGKSSYLEPNLRWYRQTSADFYRYFLVAQQPLPAAASADYRLGDMTTWTYGLKYGRKLASGHDLTVRAAYYLETGNGSPAEAVGDLKNFDLFPNVSALIFQVGYSLEM